MAANLVLTLALLGASVVMFALNRPRMDAVALMALAALPLAGLVTLPEALAGFADPNIVLIALLFVVGEGLVRTGIAQRLGDHLVRHCAASEAKLVTLLMLIVAGIGSVMSSTGVVAIFVPVVLRIARRTGIGPERLMMPLSVAALISGMLTLVGTAPNLVVHAALVREGLEGFDFFSFTPFGLPVLALAIGYMLLVPRGLGSPDGHVSARIQARAPLAAWVDEYALASREHRWRIRPGSALAGRELHELDLRATAGVNLLAIERAERFGRRLISPSSHSRLQAGDVLFLDVLDPAIDLGALARRHDLEALPLTGAWFSDLSQDIGMAEAMVPAHSLLPGQTVVQSRLRSTLGVTVIGIKRGRTPLTGRVTNETLKAGDTLLLVGPWRAIRRLAADPGPGPLVVIRLPVEFDEAPPAAQRAPHALSALLLMVVLMATGWVPNVLAALLACLLMGAWRCVDLPSAYRAIHWQSLVLIVGMLPFSLALQKTGGVDLAAQALIALVGEAGPRTILAALFAATALMGLFISNTATAVLMAPVALAVAGAQGASPLPFAMTVALAASAAFMTPVSSPVNTLVVGPGGYTFLDFVRVGVPLTALVGGACVVLVPWLLPF